jgi:hypothetical protein
MDFLGVLRGLSPPAFLTRDSSEAAAFDRTDEYADAPLQVRDQDRAATLRNHRLGLLALPTGRLVACDPLVNAYDAVAFDRRVPGGSHAVFGGFGNTFLGRRAAKLGTRGVTRTASRSARTR